MPQSTRINSDIDLYLKLIEYKRSIGVTQWTVLSLFITASEAVLVFSIQQNRELAAALMRIFALMIYWFGFFIYHRYRFLNKKVSSYIVELEKNIGHDFQDYINREFHIKGISTIQILVMVGIAYSLFAIVISWI